MSSRQEDGAAPTFLELTAILDSYLSAGELTLEKERREAYVIHLARTDPQSTAAAEAAIREAFSPPTREMIAELIRSVARSFGTEYSTEMQMLLVDKIMATNPRTFYEAVDALNDGFGGRAVDIGAETGALLEMEPGEMDFEVSDHNETEGG